MSMLQSFHCCLRLFCMCTVFAEICKGFSEQEDTITCRMPSDRKLQKRLNIFRKWPNLIFINETQLEEFRNIRGLSGLTTPKPKVDELTDDKSVLVRFSDDLCGKKLMLVYNDYSFPKRMEEYNCVCINEDKCSKGYCRPEKNAEHKLRLVNPEGRKCRFKRDFEWRTVGCSFVFYPEASKRKTDKNV